MEEPIAAQSNEPTSTESAGLVVGRLVAGQAAFVAATIHLWWGFPRMLAYLQAGSFVDPRPYLFVPSGLVLLGVVGAMLLGRRDKALYAVAAAVLAAYVLGYAWWHLGDHGGLVPGGHALGPLATILEHLLAQPRDFVSMFAELVGLGAFAALLAFDD
ncbi:hypothetical protein AUR64_00245 [Haloprofundus marisrubri]|uniref:DoxX family protein n=1 Tax=Haloprofundus marisrubri TaxID=1514971 RepID=A0A0W1RDT9_9EURY|nr:hypothetical protein [Haloprofundus marisrubri]KTG11657.1 hypothetical protein AUR64_00245 [Haloprofundus marisrubri]